MGVNDVSVTVLVSTLPAESNVSEVVRFGSAMLAGSLKVEFQVVVMVRARADPEASVRLVSRFLVVSNV